MGFLDPKSDFRYILPTETDANSPINEELMSQYRENIESNIMDVKYSGFRFKVVTVDSDTQMTVTKVDSGDEDWSSGAFAQLITSMQTGVALGNNYIIASNTALTTGNATLTFTGTTLLSDSIIAGDIGLIMFSFTGVGHTHDGIDSPAIGSDLLLVTGTGSYTWSTSGWNSLFTADTYTGLSARRFYVKLNFTLVGNFDESDFSDAQIRMVVKSGTFNYIAEDATLQTSTVATDYYGNIMTLPSGISDYGNNRFRVIVGKELFAVSAIEAGANLNAPVEISAEFLPNVSVSYTVPPNIEYEIYGAP